MNFILMPMFIFIAGEFFHPELRKSERLRLNVSNFDTNHLIKSQNKIRLSFFFCFRKIFFPKSMREGANKKKFKKRSVKPVIQT